MNILTNTSEEYSDDLGLELAILQQDIELPEITDPEEFPLNYATLFAWNEEDPERVYKLKEHEYKSMIGNFYLPVLFPLIENGESTELEFDAPNTGNILNSSLQAMPYIERNFVTLTIPKYLVMLFDKKIPAGTKFLAGFLGGSNSISNIHIIGICGDEIPLE